MTRGPRLESYQSGRARGIVLVTNHHIAVGSQEQRDECTKVSTEVVVAPGELVNISAIGRGTGNAHAAVLQRMLRAASRLGDDMPGPKVFTFWQSNPRFS